MSSIDYLDCELYLANYEQAELKVADVDYSGRPALDDETLRQQLRQAALDATQYGTLLFEALFPTGDDLLAGYREGLAVARHTDKRLRVRLHIVANAPPKLHAFNWELLYDPKKEIALGRSRDTVFSRYMSVPLEPGTPVSVKPKLLVVISSPTNLADYNKLPEIDRDETKRSIEKALGPLAGLMAYEFLDAPATAGRIRQRLVDGNFHALHIQAHGWWRSDQSMASLVLEQKTGEADFIDEDRFSEIFGDERDLRLVTLIACHGGSQSKDDPFSGLGPALVRRGIPAVLAMRQAISMNAAACFNEHFYHNLARSGQVDTGVNEARQQLYLAAPNSVEWGAPALFMRLKDGLLWKGISPVPRPPPPGSEELIWEPLLLWIRQGKVVPFLGPGINRGLLPSSAEIAHGWADQYNYPLNDRNNLPGVARFVEKKLGPGFPHAKLLQILKEELLVREKVQERERLSDLTLTEVIEGIAERHFDRDENEPHRILAELPISTYVTTNYDSFMAAALKWKWKGRKKPQRRYSLWRTDPEEAQHVESWKGTEEEPLIFHMYGYDKDSTSLVLTEDDYLDFLTLVASDPWCAPHQVPQQVIPQQLISQQVIPQQVIPQQIRSTLTRSMLLFLGYSLSDLDCRVLFRGLVAQLRDMRPMRQKDRKWSRIAVLQLDPEERHTSREDELRHFIERCCSDLEIEVIWRSVREFLIELRCRWEEDHARP